MSDDNKPAANPDDTSPSEATPHNPGLSPKPRDPSGESTPEGGPYDKKEDPAQQPS